MRCVKTEDFVRRISTSADAGALHDELEVTEHAHTYTHTHLKHTHRHTDTQTHNMK